MRYLLSLLVLLVGCSHPMPHMPQYETSQGRACAFHCQKEHDVCLGKAYGLRSRGIISACNQKLKECYQLCVEDEQEVTKEKLPGA